MPFTSVVFKRLTGRTRTSNPRRRPSVEAVGTRLACNYLAHRFFSDHAIDFLDPCGRRKMIEELIEILRHLQLVDSRMDEFCMAAWESFGITKEWFDQLVEEFRAHRQTNDA